MTDSVMCSVVALHEAAHAVVALNLGLGFRSVWIRRPDTEGIGRLMGAEGAAGMALVSTPAPDRWRDELAVLAAGDAAVRRVGCQDRSSGDARDARALAVRRGCSEARIASELAAAASRADRLVQDCWPSVERVSVRLMQAGWLLGDDVRALMSPTAKVDEEMHLLMRLAFGARILEATR